jgi:hypothetical protein
LEEYGLLTDYVMEARAIRLNSEAKEKQVSKKEALSNWVENAKKAKENLTESNLKETVENQKMITRWRGFIEDATSKIQLPESAKENRKPLDEKTREKLEENGISPESYQTISYLYSDLNGNRENIPSDIFDMLEGNKDRFHSFEEALGISPSFQSLETIPAIKSNANLSTLWNPSVYNNISWLHEEAKESIANVSMKIEKLSENASDILDMFPNMVEKWTDNKWQVDSKIWENIASQFNWIDKAGLEELKQWLVVHQLRKKSEESWIPLNENRMKERVSSIGKASEMVLQKLHSGSRQVMGEETVHAYCNTISEVCGELGDWFGFNPTEINYNVDVWLAIPFSIDGRKVPDPLVFGTSIRWPQFTKQDKWNSHLNAWYSPDRQIGSEGIPSISELANMASSIGRKAFIEDIMENPKANPFDTMKNMESDALRNLLKERLEDKKKVLKPIMERYLTDLKSQKTAMLLASQVVVASEWFSTDSAMDSEYIKQLSNSDNHFNSANGHPDIAKSLLLLNNTTSHEGRGKIKKLESSLSILSKSIGNAYWKGSLLLNELTGNSGRELLPDEESLWKQTGLSNVLSAFIKPIDEWKSEGQRLDVDALSAFADYADSSDSADKMFIESKHFTRLSPDIQKNVIVWSEKLDGVNNTSMGLEYQ